MGPPLDAQPLETPANGDRRGMRSKEQSMTVHSEGRGSENGPSHPGPSETSREAQRDATGVIPLLLIHGVGHFQSGDIEGKVAAELRERGIHGVAPLEFDWDQRVKRFEESASSAMNWDRVHRLGIALSRAAWLNVGAGNRTVPQAVRVGWALLPVLLGGILALLFWWGLAYVASSLPPEDTPALRVGLPWTSYVFPPAPPETLARSASLAAFAVEHALWVLAAFAAFMSLLTWPAARLKLAVLLRLLVLQLLWPPVYAVGATPIVLGSLAAMSIGIALISTLASIKGTVALADGPAWDVGPGFLQLAAGGGVMLALGAAGCAAAWVAWRALEPVFDVAYYLGDGEIRDFIHDQLEEVVGDIPPGERIVVGAHSLGSVIAVDSLLMEHGKWSRFDRIDLVTAGSPLQRLLARFFPDAYATPDRLTGDLSASHGNLSWTNVYRVTDYVGGALSGSTIVNQRIHRRWWRNHANYWTDPDVIDRLVRHLREGAEAERAEEGLAAPRTRSDLTMRFRSPGLPRFRYLRYMIPATALIGLIGIVWNQFVATPRLEQRNLAMWQSQITSELRDTTVRVRSGEFIDTAAETGSYALIGFTYEVDGARFAVESPPDWIPYATSRFPHVDWRRLKRDVSESAGDFDVVLEYAASNPAIFRLRDYATDPPYYSLGRLSFYSLRTIILSVFWAFWCVILYVIFDGLSPSAERTAPSKAAHEPSGVTLEPSRGAHEPSGAAHDPSGTAHDPSGATHEPSGEGHEPSGATHEPSGEGHEPSGEGHDQ